MKTNQLPSLAAAMALLAVSPIAPAQDTQDAGKPTDKEPSANVSSAFMRLGTSRLENVGLAALAPDGNMLAWSDLHGMGGVNVVALSDGKQVHYLRGRLGDFGLQACAYTADGKTIVGQTYSGLLFWDAAGGKLIRTIRLAGMDGGQPSGISVSANGSVAAAGRYVWGANPNPKSGLDVSVWADKKPEPIKTFTTIHKERVDTALSADGKLLATWGDHDASEGGQEKRTVQIWDVASGKEQRRIVVDCPAVRSLAMAPDGQTVAARGYGPLIYLLDVATGKESRRFAGRRLSGNERALLTFAPDGRSLVADDGNGGVQGWDIQAGRRLDFMDGPAGRVLSVAFTGPKRIIVFGVRDGAPYWWEAFSGKVLSPTHGHHSPIQSVVFTGANELLSASQDGRLIWWDATNGTIRRTAAAPTPAAPPWHSGFPFNWVNFVLANNGRHLLVADSDEMRLWSLEPRRLLFELDPGHEERADGAISVVFHGSGAPNVAFCPRAERLAQCRNDGRVTVWDVASGAALATLGSRLEKNGKQAPAQMLLTDSGNLLFTDCRPQESDHSLSEIVVWNVGKRAELARFTRAISNGNSVWAVSNDGKHLALAEGNGWAVRTAAGKEMHRLRAGNGPHTVTFAPDGRSIAATFATATYSPAGFSQDSRLELYETATGQLRERLAGAASRIRCVAFSADGATIAAGCNDTSILVFRLHAQQSGSESRELAEPEKIWSVLQERDARKAYGVMKQLVAAPTEALKLLRGELRPVAPPMLDHALIEKHIAELENERFAVRDKAFRALQAFGEHIQAPLEKALQGKSTLEKQRRIEELLAKLHRTELTPEELAQTRALEVIEQIGSPVALQLLNELSGGAPAARLTKEANATRIRLKDRLHRNARGG